MPARADRRKSGRGSAGHPHSHSREARSAGFSDQIMAIAFQLSAFLLVCDEVSASPVDPPAVLRTFFRLAVTPPKQADTVG